MKLVVTLTPEEAETLEANIAYRSPAPQELSYAFRAAARVGELVVEGGELSPRLRHEAAIERRKFEAQRY